MKVGLVLGAGGAVGHGFHAGVLAALEDVLGFDARTASIIVGTSAGAAAGALIRAGLTGPDLAARACGEPPSARVAQIVSRVGAPLLMSPVHPPRSGNGPASRRGIINAGLRPWNARIGTFGAAIVPEGSASTAPIVQPYRRVFGDAWPNEALWLCAVHLDDGRRVIFNGSMAGIDVGTAVAASCAVPGWFAPVEINGERYVDGGAWSPTNADVLVNEALDAVIVSSPMSSPPTFSMPTFSMPTIDSAARWLHHAYLTAETARFRTSGRPVLMIEPTPGDLAVFGHNSMDGARRPAVTRHVRASVRDRLRSGDLRSVASSLGLGPDAPSS